jgi:uncharacterized coiled-coil protein SlyX
MAQGTLEERVAYLEGKVEEHSRGYADIRDAIHQLAERVTFLDQKVDRFQEALAARIDAPDRRSGPAPERPDRGYRPEGVAAVHMAGGHPDHGTGRGSGRTDRCALPRIVTKRHLSIRQGGRGRDTAWFTDTTVDRGPG